MNEKIEKVKKDIETFLKDSMEHQNKHIDYILYDPNNDDTYVLVSDDYGEAIEFTPFTKEYEGGYLNVPEWDYNFDYYIYNYLEEGKRIGYMTDEVHYSIWNSIHELYPEDIDYKDGVQIYLQYCADNGITKEYLDKKTGFDTPNIMQHYKSVIESEKAYFTFVLGYDLLNDKLSQMKENECDVVYDFCEYLTRTFVETEYYKDMSKSAYDNLKEWIEDNKDIIQSEYLYYFNIENKHILEIGQRNNEKVALVERKFEDGTKEYIIAFHYKVDDEKLEWDYGYYYADNITKAKKDFEKVKAGGNLADTFDKKKKEISAFKKNQTMTLKEKKAYMKKIRNKERER